MAAKKIFITGSAGKIGKPVMEMLLKNGHTITILSPAKEKIMPDNRIRIIKGDIREPVSYENALRGMDTVLHMAAVTHTNNVRNYYGVNAEGTQKLLAVSKAGGIKRFIFISTRAISKAGGDYSQSKIEAEKYIINSGISYVILRVAEVYGIGGKGIDRLIRDIKRLPFIPIAGDGEYLLAPVHISDVAEAIVNAVENDGISNRTYTIAGPESLTFNKLIDEISSAEKITPRHKIHIPERLFKMILAAASFVTGDKFMVKDQLPRLLCEKDYDITSARKELNFNPARVRDIYGK